MTQPDPIQIKGLPEIELIESDPIQLETAVLEGHATRDPNLSAALATIAWALAIAAVLSIPALVIAAYRVAL